MRKHKFKKLIKNFFHILRKVLKKCWLPLAILIITMAVLFSLFRALTPWAKQYKSDVEKHLSVLLGQPVTINDLETSWYWFEPVLKMDQVTLSDTQDHVLKLNKLLVGINLFSSLWHWQIKPGVLYVDDVHLTIRQVHDHWDVDGLSQNKQSMTISPSTYSPVLVWLLAQERIILKNISGTVHFADNTSIVLKQLNFTAVHSYGHYRLSGHAELDQKVPTVLSVVADLQIDPAAFKQVSGHGYISLQNVLPKQWQNFFPKSTHQIQSGKGDIELWLDLSKGNLTALQSKIQAHNLTWIEEGHPKKESIEFLQANIAWGANREGWKLTADHLNVRIGDISWPENALLIDYKSAQNRYRVFIKNLLLESVLATGISWPENLQALLAKKPHGDLHDTQIILQDSQVAYLLTRFANFGWTGQNGIPTVKQISGVLYWQPTEGRLELDGENTLIAPKGLPPLTFGLLNAAFDWKNLNNELRVSMDRFVLSHPNLVFSARGALDEPHSEGAGNLRLTAEFAAKDAVNLINYIPSQYLKPKLDEWLKKDIKHIGNASGRIIVNGPLADFPFDNKPGEFTINSHVSGVDLLINPDWPINHDIDADIRVDKRQFNANIFHADLKGVIVDKFNLAINDIGLGKESLLIHGAINAPANQIKAYVFASPLRHNLSKLKQLKVKDSLGLDLRLDIPLYPESDHVLALGKVTFNNNQAVFKAPLSDIVADNVSGELQFNEYGISNGGLQGTVAGEMITLQAQSISEPKPYTEINILGTTTINLLRKAFPVSVLAFMEGELKLHSLFTLHESADELDHLHMDSSLEGVAIDLPLPLGKTKNEARPLAIDVDFNPDKTMELHLNYANGLSGDLLFSQSREDYTLKKGSFRLGEGQAVLPKRTGVEIVGTLPSVDIQLWRETLSQMPTETSPMMDSVHTIDLKLANAEFFHQKYNNLSIKAHRNTPNDWSVKLIQTDILGNLRYQLKENLISGNFEHLHLNKWDVKQHNVAKSTLKPKDIPNLNITVDSLKIGDVDVGQLSIKSASTDKQWLLDYCKIRAPEYQFSVRGDWTMNAKQNLTSMEAGLQIQDLSKSLERWHITPAVQASTGDVQFEVEWPGAVSDFSLDAVRGKMNISLKNGRISHFDKETENKLGLGKLLSILSLQTIPRRLKLDFSDLSEQGYSFDVFKGSFTINRGVMNTKDAYIDGPVAYASMKGDLDLSKQLYDVDLRISPYIAASLPVVATIAGGPIAGVATWVASNIINKGMQKISGYTYKVSGPWSDPIVQQVSIDRTSPKAN